MTKNPNSHRPRSTVSPNAVRLASLLLVIVTIIGLGAVAYFTERGIVVSRDWVIHTYQVRSQLSDLQLEIMRAHANETAYLLTPEQAEHQRPQKQADLARQTVTILRNLTRDNPRQQARLAQLGPLLEQGISLIESRRATAGTRPYVSPPEQMRQAEIDDREKLISAIVKGMQDEEEVLLQQRLNDWDYLFKRNVLMLGFAFAVVAIMLAYNFRRLLTEVARTKDTEKRVRANADSYRLMSARILELQDSERRRIARELHDSVGQFLAGLKINLSQLEMGSQADPEIDLRDPQTH